MIKPVVIFDNLLKYSLYALVFLLPLWFLPITQDSVHFQKQVLLIALVLVAMVAWLAKTVQQGELAVRTSWWYLLLSGFIVITGAATVTSLWKYGSFWGWPLSVYDSFLTIFFFGLFVFLLSNFIKESKELVQVFSLLTLSGFIAGVFAVLQAYQVYVFPFATTRVNVFNTVGSVHSISVLMAILLPLALTLAFAWKGMIRWGMWALAGALLIVMLLINFFYAWIVLTAGLLVLLAFGVWNLRKKAEFGWVTSCMVLLVIALFMVAFRLTVPIAPLLPFEVSPSISTELGILKNVLMQNPILGTGPGTFVFNFEKYHQTSINNTLFWGTRFATGSSAVLDQFVAQGLLGGLALLALMVVTGFFAVKSLVASRGDLQAWLVRLGLFAAFVAAVVAQMIYYSNFTLAFIFWALLAGIASFAFGGQKRFSVKPPSSLSVIVSFAFLLFLIFGVGLLFIGGQKYLAEVAYFRGAQMVNKGDIEKGGNKILSAASLNPSVDMYWRDLAQLYLSQLNQILNNPNIKGDARKQQIQIGINNTTSAANQAVAVNAGNVENWNVRGFIYRSLTGVQGAHQAAVESYTRAIALEPTSPFSYTELGRVYLTQAQTIKNQNGNQAEADEALNKALENLTKAIELKADYSPAHYLTAVVYGEQGKSAEEIAKLESTKSIAPTDVGLAFQLGVLYYQGNQLQKAQVEFERAKSLAPEYANGRYMLGLTYDKQGNRNGALGEFKKVLELNPDNDLVKKIIENLEAGRAALTGLNQGQAPLDENPPEIQNNN